jgi:hypothetical protein
MDDQQVAEEPALEDESHKDFTKAEALKNEGNELFRSGRIDEVENLKFRIRSPKF